jgi:hypothetical protein
METDDIEAKAAWLAVRKDWETSLVKSALIGALKACRALEQHQADIEDGLRVIGKEAGRLYWEVSLMRIAVEDALVESFGGVPQEWLAEPVKGKGEG